MRRGAKGKECARCQNTITDKLTAKAVGPKTNTQHLENTEACNSLSYHRGQHTTTQTHGAYGAVQAGGHLSVLVAVNGRVPTAASLGGSSGRGRCRGVTLQAIRERLPCPVICKKKRSHMHYPVRGACTASGSMLRSAVPCLCLARTFYGGRDGKRVKAGPRARKEGYQNPSIVYTHKPLSPVLARAFQTRSSPRRCAHALVSSCAEPGSQRQQLIGSHCCCTLRGLVE